MVFSGTLRVEQNSAMMETQITLIHALKNVQLNMKLVQIIMETQLLQFQNV